MRVATLQTRESVGSAGFMQHSNMVRAGSTSSMGSGTNANPPMPIYKAPTASVERVRGHIT